MGSGNGTGATITGVRLQKSMNGTLDDVFYYGMARHCTADTR
jgi:hypothetical protein